MKILAGVVIGGIIGGLLGLKGNCSKGACPLTSNPYTGAIFGAIMGLLIATGAR